MGMPPNSWKTACSSKSKRKCPSNAAARETKIPGEGGSDNTTRDCACRWKRKGWLGRKNPRSSVRYFELDGKNDPVLIKFYWPTPTFGRTLCFIAVHNSDKLCLIDGALEPDSPVLCDP